MELIAHEYVLQLSTTLKKQGLNSPSEFLHCDGIWSAKISRRFNQKNRRHLR